MFERPDGFREDRSLVLEATVRVSDGAQALVGGFLHRRWECLRIRLRLWKVENQLRRAPVTRLTEAERRARASNLDRLHEYWKAGRFPQNNDPGRPRTPIFKDEGGTPCAVAYLMERSGEAALVGNIAQSDNRIQIRDVRESPLLAWLKRAGLTQEEAIRIQPAYHFSPFLDLQLMVFTLLGALLILKLVGLAVARYIAAGRARIVTPLRVTLAVLASMWIAISVVSGYSPTFTNPGAAPFRTIMFGAFLAALLPLELLSGWLIGSTSPTIDRRRMAAEAHRTVFNVVLATVIGMSLVWVLVPILL